ncbi:hypothetical protein GGF42_001409 [Coemansia sp. RSA 2424]|nr:hypothetical protein GGF42_001409 [Coemansia sp. RSA 2424]
MASNRALIRGVRGLWQARRALHSSSGGSCVPPESRMSWMLLPTKKPAKRGVNGEGQAAGQSTTDLLTKAGYIYQSSAGIYTLMPLAQRVVSKIEQIIDEEMRRVGGQKLAMPNLLTPENWRKTGRWESTGSELFSFKDRKGATMLLGPTHEEEVTAIVKDMVRSYRQYPLRLYQTTRKFRDEARPRAGLLRGREFIMKDMYTFDVGKEQAIETFHAMEAAYRRCFDRVGVTYAVAEADSGNIGGSLSKEFHFVNQSGEDTLLKCGSCKYMANEERALSKSPANKETGIGQSKRYVARVVEGSDGKVVQQRIVEVADGHEPSALKIKRLWTIKPNQRLEVAAASADGDGGGTLSSVAEFEPMLLDDCAADVSDSTGDAVRGDWHVAKAGDACGECSGGVLEAQRAIEVGHIFYLGDKYSKALDLSVLRQGQREYVQMGCFGIGVSRVLQAAAECSSMEGRGLRWPLSIAPYLASVVPVAENSSIQAADEVYRALSSTRVCGAPIFKDNVIVDDRDYLSAGFRLNDAQLMGIPVTIVLGSGFAESGQVEVQLRVPGMQSIPGSAAAQAAASSTSTMSDRYEHRVRVKVAELGSFLAQALEGHCAALAMSEAE